MLLGLSYNHKIDVWSLACVLVEIHTGEPLFGGLDQVDQFCRVVDVLGMPPASMLDRSPTSNMEKFFEKVYLLFIILSLVHYPFSLDVYCSSCKGGDERRNSG